MAISDRTRKILWGRSGNLCAYCKRTLVEDGTPLSSESVVGDECHIIGEKPTAARGSLGMGRDDLDEYDNLVLFCKVHHKLVDDQPETYPVVKLRELKTMHERWVKETLGKKPGLKPRFTLLLRVTTGRTLADIIGNSHAYSFDHDELETETDTKLVSDFLGSLQDWGEIWRDLDSSEHVKARFTLTGSIKEIEASGFYVFGARETRKMVMKTNNARFDCDVATVAVVRSTNPGITELGDLAAVVAADAGSGIL